MITFALCSEARSIVKVYQLFFWEFTCSWRSLLKVFIITRERFCLFRMVIRLKKVFQTILWLPKIQAVCGVIFCIADILFCLKLSRWNFKILKFHPYKILFIQTTTVILVLAVASSAARQQTLFKAFFKLMSNRKEIFYSFV